MRCHVSEVSFRDAPPPSPPIVPLPPFHLLHPHRRTPNHTRPQLETIDAIARPPFFGSGSSLTNACLRSRRVTDAHDVQSVDETGNYRT